MGNPQWHQSNLDLLRGSSITFAKKTTNQKNPVALIYPIREFYQILNVALSPPCHLTCLLLQQAALGGPIAVASAISHLLQPGHIHRSEP